MNYLLNKNSKRFFGKPILANNLFAEISPEGIKKLRKIFRPIIFKENQIILKVGDLPHHIYFFNKGKAHIYLNQNSQKEVFVRKIIEKEILGLPESISSFRYEIGVKTDSYCLCEYVKIEEFTEFLYTESSICFTLLDLLSHNLNESYKNFSATNIF